ncbi:SDR family oxidoreductase [Haloplanus halobius]|uniref:SDR family oxidoreductase n=1 Tax=Haloplanus halobius TaxID=2934938 RepID=UPI00200E740B|nr:SDR family oxidoreductase [Haloplanus sp. XH21]
MDLGLDGDTALVSASSSGLGKAAATALAAEGANVVVNGRDPDRLDAAVADIRADATGEVIGVRGDITDESAVMHLVDRTVEEFGGLDHLVTSAGGPPSGPFLETNDEDWYEAFDLLVMSVVRLAREATPHLKDGGGTITTITSGSVKEAIDSLVLSNAVRMSVVGLEKTLSTELAPDVRANTVLPGTHETPRIEELVEQGVERGDYPDYDTGLEEWSAGNPMERIGQPEEFGDVIAFLCSERASYVNGAAIPVDGGGHASNL